MFNGYEIIRNELSRQETVDLKPIDIVYKPSFNENSMICHSTSKTHTAYKSYIGQF